MQHSKKIPHSCPGGLYHVMMRGNGGEDIFFEDDDRYHFYLFAQQGLERFGHRIHGFCCMTNHDHLVVQVGDIPLSKIIQNLSFRYTRWINQRNKRIGHLFQGRYKALLIDADSYLLELVRYIHLNPCRAGMVKDPIQYPWSCIAYVYAIAKGPVEIISVFTALYPILTVSLAYFFLHEHYQC
jgi:putative transposase